MNWERFQLETQRPVPIVIEPLAAEEGYQQVNHLLNQLHLERKRTAEGKASAPKRIRISP